MIAPARVAAYEALRAVDAGRADLPHALARVARAPARRARPRARRRDRHRHAALAGGVRSRHRAVRAPPGRAGSIAEVLDILRLSIFQLLHLDRVPASAVVNDAVSLARKAGKKSAAPLVNACCAASAASGSTAAAAAAAIAAIARRARLPVDHAVASALARGALAGSPRLRRGRGVGCASTTSPARADAARQPAEDHARRAAQRRSRRRRRDRAGPLCAGRSDRHATATRCSRPWRDDGTVLRPGRSVATGGAFVDAAPGRAGARRLRLPRRQDDAIAAAHGRIAASSSRPTFAGGGSICWRGPWPRPARRRFASSRRTPAALPFRAGVRLRCCWTRRVPASVRSGATPTCAGAGARPT